MQSVVACRTSCSLVCTSIYMWCCLLDDCGAAACRDCRSTLRSYARLIYVIATPFIASYLKHVDWVKSQCTQEIVLRVQVRHVQHPKIFYKASLPITMIQCTYTQLHESLPMIMHIARGDVFSSTN